MVVFCAGSLARAMRRLVDSHAATAIDLVAGPAGILCVRVVGGERADVFLSASPTAPRWLAAAHGYAPPVTLCHNRLAVVARPGLRLAVESALDLLLDPDLTLACSTPGADPGGDYAMALFDALDAERPGSAAALRMKAVHPFGGHDNSAPVDGMSPAVAALKRGVADVMVVYRTTADATVAAVPGATAVTVPDAWLPRTDATLTWRADADEETLRFVAFLRGPRAAAVIAGLGLEPAA